MFVVDTSVWIAYFRGEKHQALDRALQDGAAWLSPLVASELLSGVRNERRGNELRSFFEDLPLVETNLDHWLRVGELRSRFLRRGITVSTPDAHIAQCCKDLGCGLLTRDKIFLKISPLLDLHVEH